MLPVIAIVGRPNVGKSTLFNRITKSNDALVLDIPGVTRDRQYGEATFEDRSFILIDTGGIAENEKPLDDHITDQTEQAIEEADVVLFLLDANAGVSGADQDIVKFLRRITKPMILVINKSDGVNIDMTMGDYHALGFKSTPVPISASQGHGVRQLMQQAMLLLPEQGSSPLETDDDRRIRIAIIGKPNVGKSTLTNRMLGEERVIAFDEPGTTRDSIFIPLDRHNKQYTLIDTAGIRRKKNVDEALEKFSIIKSLKAIEASHVVLFVVDAREGLKDQDLKLLGFIVDAGKALVLAINKWDGLTPEQRSSLHDELESKTDFLSFAKRHFISALHGTGVGNLFDSIDEAYESATRKLSTPEITRLLEDAIKQHQPPMVRGRRIKLRYAHPGGQNPPIIVIHGNQVDDIPDSYKRYLVNFFQKALRLFGTPIRVQFKGGVNPYKDRTNKLTQSQYRNQKRVFMKKRGQSKT